MAKVIMCDACKQTVTRFENNNIIIRDINRNIERQFDLCDDCYEKLTAMLDWNMEEESENGSGLQ
jgi:hypothetical protein